MSESRHVNDSTSAFNAVANCAICTIAGLFGRTYSEFIRMLGRSEQSFLGGVNSTVDQVFVNLGAKYTATAPNDNNRTQLQVDGVEGFLRGAGVRDLRVVGTIAQPLSSNDLMRTLFAAEPGTKFAILVGGSMGNSHFVSGAHWFACHRVVGPPALRFIDYQMDSGPATDDMIRWRQVPRGTALGAPGDTIVPCRPWGENIDTASDHFIIVAFRPPGG